MTMPAAKKAEPIAKRSPSTESDVVAPRSIIVVIADGAGVGAYAMGHRAAIAASGSSPFQRFAHVGLMTTDPAGPEVTDSAASATALATGVKVPVGSVGVDGHGKSHANLLELAKGFELGFGLVATSSIAHATPAAFATHVTSREDEVAIMAQLVAAEIDVMFGGGQSLLGPHTDALTTAGVQLVETLDRPIDPQRRVIGLFDVAPLPRASERRPSTTQMARRAVELLDTGANGFVLVIEESQVDWAEHDNDPSYLAGEVGSFVELVDAMLDVQRNLTDALLVVTSDHDTGSVGLTIDAQGGSVPVFASTEHTANLVPIWAVGPGGDRFEGLVDNASVGATLHDLLRRRYGAER